MTAPSILLVEDDVSLRMLTARALRESGYAVRTAATGAEMWVMLEAEPAGVPGLVRGWVLVQGGAPPTACAGVPPGHPPLRAFLGVLDGYTLADLLDRRDALGAIFAKAAQAPADGPV